MLPIKFYIQGNLGGLDRELKISLCADIPWQREVQLFSGSNLTEVEFGFLTIEEAQEFAEYLEGTAHEIRTMINGAEREDDV